MNDIVLSILAGAIQGVAEFLPISSSGHLVLFHDIFGLNLIDDLAFDVILHLGTLAALVIFFWKDILKYFLSFLKSFYLLDFKNDFSQRLPWYILFSTIPAAFAGYFWENEISTVFRQPLIVAITFITIGLILYFSDWFFAKSKSFTDITFTNSIIIGLAQSLALIPGVSRSGITIIAGLSQKLNREAAARFSFLLSIPIVFGAGLKKVIDLLSQPELLEGELLVLALGFLSSAIIGIFCIKYFLRFLQNHSLKIFAIYRLLVGAVIILFILFVK